MHAPLATFDQVLKYFVMKPLTCIMPSCSIVSFSKNEKCLIEIEKIIFKIINTNFKTAK
jgi:hypothetical protein